MRRAIGLGVAYIAGTISGLSKQFELPQLVDKFEHAGIPSELLSLFGAVEFVLALALLFPRTRRPAAVLLATSFGWAAYMMAPQGLDLTLVFYGAMVPLVLFAGFWRPGAFARHEPYMGAMPLGVSKPRR